MTEPRKSSKPRATWYRLSDDAWAMIRMQYLDGATAKQLAAKWGTSPTSVYRHACAEGWTKQRRGEAVSARVLAEERARMEAERAASAAREAEEPELLFDPEEALQPQVLHGAAMRLAARALASGKGAEAERMVRLAERINNLTGRANPVPLPAPTDAELDPMVLLMDATTSAGAAMNCGRLEEAQALLRLADGYARAAAGNREAVLEIVFDALFDEDYRAQLFHYDRDERRPHPVKLRYHEEMARRRREAREARAGG